MMDTCLVHLFKAIERSTARVNPNGNYGLLVTMTCLCGFTDGNKGTTLVREAF